MKLTKLSKYLLFLLIGISLFSCQKDKPEDKLLHKAQSSLAMGKPNAALDLLASIRHPESMNKDSYMQYIVTHIGAKYEVGEDIKNDTLIFEAQRYFNKEGNPEESALANYYAAQVYDVNSNFPKALESYMHTVYEADKSNSYLLAGKSYNNIGYIYFEKDLFDSAIVNYQKALFYCDKVENADNIKLKTLTYIGSAYTVEEKMDSAFLYFNKCLSLANEIENKPYQFYSLKNLGIVSYGKQDYNTAIDYFQSALALNMPEKLEINKIHLYLLNIYNKKQDPKSAKQYADLVIAGLPEVTYKYTVREMYTALAEYYTQSGDYKQALQFSGLEKATKEQIEKEANVLALLEADKNFYLAQKDRQAQQYRSQVFLLVTGGAIVLVVILFFVLLGYKNHKKDQKEIQMHIDKYNALRETFMSDNERYPRIEAEIKAMLEDEDDEK